jgi:hypothetical protein
VENQEQSKQPPALKHGGAAAERALSTGDDFTGLARETEKQVTAELEAEGIEALVRRDAIRLQTVSDLYYQAILGAADMDRLDVLVKRWGWIQASTLRAWQQVHELEKKQSKRDITDLLGGTHGD